MLETINNLIKTEFLDNTLLNWGLFVFSSIGLFIFGKIFQSIIYKNLSAISQKTANKIDDYLSASVKSVSGIFILFLAIFISSNLISLDEKINERVSQFFLLIFFWQLTKWAIMIANLAFEKYKNSKKSDNDMHSVTAITGLSKLAKFLIWSLFLLLALDNIGVDITALVAGLGIGGLAIALAAQSILGDLFASLTIMIDKPIALGDYIVVDNYMGTVKSIGIKSTKIESISGEEIIISNSDLLNSRLRNYHQSRMQKRRTTIMIGVVYNTSYVKLSSIQSLLTEIVNTSESTEFIRASMVDFADFSLNFELVYNVLSSDYSDFIETNHKIRLKIFEKFSKEKIDFAFPTRTIHVHNEGVKQ